MDGMNEKKICMRRTDGRIDEMYKQIGVDEAGY
jgi:hypothetical protein